MRGAASATALFALLVLGSVLTGCVTARKYKMAKADAPRAARLDYSAEMPSLELKLVTVIVYDGPGSWKQRALWDEYVVSLTNRSAGPLTVETAALLDPLGVEQAPGTDPWKLELLSETSWRKYNKAGQFVLGVGAFAGAVELSAIGYGVAGGVLSGIFFVMPAVLLADIGVVAVMNHRNKVKVEKEFERRRMKLPLTIAAGQGAAGSLFFPLVPAPRQLTLKGRMGGGQFELTLDLGRLANLHRRSERNN